MSEPQGRARKLKVPNPSASTGKEVKEKKQACAGFLTVGCHLSGVQGGLGRRSGEIQVQGSARGWVGCKSICKS